MAWLNQSIILAPRERALPGSGSTRPPADEARIEPVDATETRLRRRACAAHRLHYDLADGNFLRP
jgi:hypothetical protein